AGSRNDARPRHHQEQHRGRHRLGAVLRVQVGDHVRPGAHRPVELARLRSAPVARDASRRRPARRQRRASAGGHRRDRSGHAHPRPRQRALRRDRPPHPLAAAQAARIPHRREGKRRMIPAALAAAALFTAPEIPKDKGYAVQEIRGGLYWVTDGAYNTMFLVHESGVIAVDPLPTLGPRYLEAIAQVTKKPITHVVYSHEHTDHIGAARLFPSSATFIAQRETAELLAARKDPRRPVPSIQFVDRSTLEVGGQRLVLEYRGVNHSRGNVFIHAPKQRVLMLVDVVYPGFMPYKNLGIAEDVQGYLDAHRQALSYDFDVLVG